MKAGRQTTIAERITLAGAGVHSGSPSSLILHPAGPDTGIVFVRGDADGREVEARFDAVYSTDLATVLGYDQAIVSTVEHLMAALAGMGVDNCIVEVDSVEVPILDGSAAPFATAIAQAGVVALQARRKYLKVLKPVRVTHGRAFAELQPFDKGFRLDVEIDFDHPLIGRQRKALTLDAPTFRREIARARTFGFMRDVAKLWSAGYALGSSLDNTVVIGDDRILNPEGLRFTDECVRHKMLDAIGDLSLAGYPILGQFRSYCGGHKLNQMVLKAMFADESAFEITEAPAERRERRYAAVGPQLAMPLYRADVN